MQKDSQDIVIAAAVDDAYALPLLVALYSACSNLAGGWYLQVFVLDLINSPVKRQLVSDGLVGQPVQLHWCPLHADHVAANVTLKLRPGDAAIYARLLLAEVLPISYERVLFLDADVMVLGDLSAVWKSDFEGYPVQAVPDAYAERLHLPRLHSLKKSGRPAISIAEYFNAGVLLIDLHAWRQQCIAEQAIAMLADWDSQFYMKEQDALNCVLDGRWKALNPCWNFHALPHLLRYWYYSSTGEIKLQCAIEHPCIVHFIGIKPWKDGCSHWYANRWLAISKELGHAQPLTKSNYLNQFWYLGFRIPHAKSDWLFEMKFRRLRKQDFAGDVIQLLIRAPWLVVSYPLWRCAMHLRARLLFGFAVRQRHKR